MVSSYSPSRHHTSDASPPPSYRQAQDPPGSPLLLAETTTREVVTTTTTRFLLLPWRKRVVSASRTEQIPDAQGMHRPPRSFVQDKALPPTPGERVDGLSSSANQYHLDPSPEESIADLEQSQVISSPSSSDLLAPNDHLATHALARASLGLGFPHVIPRASLPSSPSVPSAHYGLNSNEPDLSASSRAFSVPSTSQTSRNHPTVDAASSSAASNDSRRTRRLSLGPAGFLGLGTDGAGKEEKQKDSAEQSSGMGLTRRASFWLRRKTRASTEMGPSEVAATPDKLQLPMLPTFTPLTPLYADIQASPSLFQTRHARGLSRSSSDRAISIKSPCSTTTPGPSLANPTLPSSPFTRRPKTSDSTTPRTRSRSFFGYELSNSPSSASFAPEPIPASTSSSHSSGPPAVVNARPRSSTNPPLLHRLSVSLFSSPSPSSRGQDGIRGSLSSPTVSSNDSPRPSFQRPAADIPQPRMDAESPEVYLMRLMAAVSKAEVASICASSSGPFHVRALRAYIDRFDFIGLPLDVALRKLLMDVGLPRETQQIDRVMEAFASRYTECNPNLYISDDQPYILAFSLIMLHTDAFNKSNKRKMTKADYIKNTRLPGLPLEVLDYFYDNIVFAPFIFVEDPVDVNGQRGFNVPNDRRAPGKLLLSHSIDSSSGGTNVLAKATKIDPYLLISQGMLDPLRVNVEQCVPMANPYTYEGTAGAWDEEGLRRSFTNAVTLELCCSDMQASPFFSLSVGSAPSALMSSSLVTSPAITPSVPDPVFLRVTKVGLLWRKDDILPGGKKASSRKWRQLSVVLTGSQILLFRDAAWATALSTQSVVTGEQARVNVAAFKPDELLSVKDAIAVYDESYIRHNHTFRFAKSDGRHILFRASDEVELNQWISCVNYASAFKSAGIRMRALGMSGNDVRLTGIAAATSHLHDLQHRGVPRVPNWDVNTSRELMSMLSETQRFAARDSPPRTSDEDEDVEVPVAPEVEGAAQFEVTFDQVKAELATGRWNRHDQGQQSPMAESGTPLTAELENISFLTSRSQVVSSKISDIEAKLSASQTQLDSDLRFVRNIATLTPFQRSTHDRLAQAVQNIAGRIMRVRLNVARLACHRHVLTEDLRAEKRDLDGFKKLALQVATETLQTQLEKNLPKTTLSVCEADVAQPLLSPRPSSVSVGREPSVCESFHSALEFGPEWPILPEDPDSSLLNGASTVTRSNSAASLRPTDQLHTDTSQSDIQPSTPPIPSPLPVKVISTHEKYFTAMEMPEEEAEDWNKTRCAQRVSLVRLPSGNDITTLLQKHVVH